MIEYPAVAHKIPACFARKIELDKQRATMKAASVVGLRDFKLLRGRMLVCRDQCQVHVQRQRGGTGGAMG